MNIKIYDKNNIDTIPILKESDANHALNYLIPFIKGNINELIENVYGEMRVLLIEKKWVIPLFIPYKNKNNAYVCSLYSHYVSYCKEELKELKNPVFEKTSSLFLNLLGLMLKSANIDKCVYINNWLVSTNLYTNLPSKYIKFITEFVAKEFRGYTVAWCSINDCTTEKLYKEMKCLNFMFLPSRSIYIVKDISIPTRNNKRSLKNDLDLMKDGKYIFKKIEYNNEIRKLYNNIYIDKYSAYNPKFTDKYFKTVGINDSVQYYMLSNKKNKNVGIIGFFTSQKILTTPILGYDINIKKEDGLYRRLTAKIFLECQEKNYIMHASSGVGKFKMSRGGERYWEYRTFYIKGINIYRKLVFKILEFITRKIACPLMDKKGL